MKKILVVGLMCISYTVFSQVGINNTDPKASLDISASNPANPANTDGILIPRVDAFPVTNPTAAQQGMMVYLTTTSGSNPPGFYYWDNTLSIWQSISGTKNTLDQAYDEGGAGAGRTITADNGRVQITGVSEMLSLSSTNITGNNQSTFKINSVINSNFNDGISIGLYGTNPVPAPNISETNAIRNYIRHSTINGVTTGLNNKFVLGTNNGGINTGVKGVYNYFYSNTNINGTNWGISNNFISGSNRQVGLDNYFLGTSNAAYGVYNHTNSQSEFRGVYNDFNNTSNPGKATFGIYNSIKGSSNGNKYGSYTLINSSAGGVHYGTYNDVQKTSGYAGYFIGRMSLGNATTNRYIMPGADGTANQIMQTNGSGQVSFVNPTTVGTDDQTIDTFSFNSGTNILTLEVENDGVAAQAVDLSSLQDGTGTDDQNISGSGLTGTNLTIGIENGSSQVINLASLQDGTGTDDQTIDTFSFNSGTNILTLEVENDGVAAQTVDLSSLQTDDADWYVENTTNTTATTNSQDIFTNGNVGIGVSNVTFPLTINSTNTTNISLVNTGSGNSTRTGINNVMDGTGHNKIGIRNSISGSGFIGGQIKGIDNIISINAPNNSIYGMFNSFDNAISHQGYGIFNIFNPSSNFSLDVSGIYNIFDSSAYIATGIRNVFTGNISNTNYGMYNSNSSSVSNDNYGMYNDFSNTGNGTHYGAYTILTGTGTGNKYGYTSTIVPSAGGIHYGFFSSVLKTNSYAAFFLGRVAIGTGVPNIYILPSSRGTNGQIMQTNGSGFVNWVNSNTIGTDDQNITGSGLSGTNLTIGIENGTSETIDLSSLQDGIGATKIDELTDGKSDATGSTIFFGNNAGAVDDGTDNNNIGIGLNSLQANTSGNENVAIGVNSLNSNTTSRYNIAIGSNALSSTSTNGQNLAIGYNALAANTSNTNVALGYSSLQANTSGSSNVALGHGSGISNTGTGNVFIGKSAGAQETTASNKLYIENSNSNASNALIYGEFDNNILRTNGEFQVRQNSTNALSHIILTENQGDDGARIRFNNSVETNNQWLIFGRADNTIAESRFNINHTTTGNIIHIRGDGRVGINDNNPTYALELPNDNTISVGQARANNWVTYSDSRLKKNQTSLTYGLKELLEIQPKSYLQYASEFKNGKLVLIPNSEKKEIGFIAQELYQIIPESTFKPENENNDLWSVNYEKIIPVTVQAIKELNTKIELLKNKNLKQEREIKKLKQLVNQYASLEERLKALEENNSNNPNPANLLSNNN